MTVIDISSWQVDKNHEIFPVGARDKMMVWSPSNNNSEHIKSEWPYLFKESIRFYPDQFWAEIIAHKVSESLGVNVPRAIPSFRRNQDDEFVCGALIEWFYDQDIEIFHHASVYFQRLIDNFDNKHGAQHNLEYLQLICRAFSQKAHLITSRQDWLCDMALFDALIGNTDRHQENWGFIFSLDANRDIQVEISPLFDNGTSLGHERFTERVNDWSESRFSEYIERGYHHLRISREHLERFKLFDLVSFLAEEPRMKAFMQSRLSSFNFNDVEQKINAMTAIEMPVRLTSARAEWIIRNLNYRYNRIMEILS